MSEQEKPVRLQLSRRKGFNLQQFSTDTNGLSAVNVARPSKWGNPFVIGAPCGVFPEGMGRRGAAETLIPELSRGQVIDFYRNVLDGFLSPEMYPAGHDWLEKFRAISGWPGAAECARSTLRGKNLACFCGPDDTCHADVLLEVANR